MPPWKLEAFESDSLEELFESVKKDSKMLIDIAIGFMRDEGTVPEARIDEIKYLFESLLMTPAERSLDLLLSYQPRY